MEPLVFRGSEVGAGAAMAGGVLVIFEVLFRRGYDSCVLWCDFVFATAVGLEQGLHLQLDLFLLQSSQLSA